MTPARTQRLTAPLLEGTKIERQIALERSAVQDGVDNYKKMRRKAEERGGAGGLKPAERLILHWGDRLTEAIRSERRKHPGPDDGLGRGLTCPVLRLLSPQRCAVAALHAALSECLPAGVIGVKVSVLAYRLGRAVLAEANLLTLKRSSHDQYQELLRRTRQLSVTRVNYFANKAQALCDEKSEFHRKVCSHTGIRLLWLLIQHCPSGPYDAENFRLAFHHFRTRRGGKTTAFVALDRAVLELVENGHHIRSFLRPVYRPMVIPPCPWVENPPSEGGYTIIRTPFISRPTSDQAAALKSSRLGTFYQRFNALVSNPWRINQRVLDVQQQVWSSGGGTLGLPLPDDEPKPGRPDSFATAEDEIRWKRSAVGVHRRNLAARSARFNFLENLESANALRGEPRLYYPHQIDYRGRAYPIPRHPHHQDHDTGRALLEIADPSPDSPRSLWWLRVHAANEFGLNKSALTARARWSDEHATEIGRSARDPLGFDWWRQAKNPWQFLAACFALDDPEGAGRHMPVGQDGTCNGLQHYTALGRDSAAAPLVNMTPCTEEDEPASVYRRVAEETANLVRQDAADAVAHAARVLLLIEPGLVKQNVMTSVYGVTRNGASKQVLARLKETDLAREHLYACANYLAGKVMQGIGGTCQSAARIMAWITSCARAIAATGRLVGWTTPLGLPVVQPYRKWRTVQIETILQTLTLPVDAVDVPIAPGRHARSAAPNFVHSLDATHMLETAWRCAGEGIWFAARHDCYVSSAGHADRLARLLREEFVRLHHRPILDDLRTEWIRTYKIELPEPPPTGLLQLDAVLRSANFFS